MVGPFITGPFFVLAELKNKERGEGGGGRGEGGGREGREEEGGRGERGEGGGRGERGEGGGGRGVGRQTER